MKAAILRGYDKNGCDLEIRDIPVPEISEKEVLVKIRTAGVNPLDNMIIRGEVKLIVSYSFPLVMGNEFVGIIEKIGSAVKGFAAGDRVYGRMPLQKIGAFAEYAAIDASAIAKVPEYLSDEFILVLPKVGQRLFDSHPVDARRSLVCLHSLVGFVHVSSVQYRLKKFRFRTVPFLPYPAE